MTEGAPGAVRIWVSAHVELKSPEWDQDELADMTDAEILDVFREDAIEIIKGEWEVHREADAAENLKMGLEKIDEGMKVLSNGPLSYYTGEAQMMIAMLFDRFCPWEVGDSVVLVNPVDFENAHGWKSAEHWLKPGVRGCIRSVGARAGLFTADVAFADESWISDVDGQIHPSPNSHVWGFSERQIVKVEP